jgi:hypothetical protein
MNQRTLWTVAGVAFVIAAIASFVAGGVLSGALLLVAAAAMFGLAERERFRGPRRSAERST